MNTPNEKNLTSVAIIMDGNGRWATKRGLPRTSGHLRGVKNIKRVLGALREMGVKHVTLYAFSTENWKRPRAEVDAIMKLACKYIDSDVIPSIKKDPEFAVRFLGDKSPLPEELRKRCLEVEAMSNTDNFVLNVALNYGGRAEIVNAVNEAIKNGHTELTEDIISHYVYTAHSPDPDLIIRTGGEFRISNFLLWQSAYSEYYITDTLWPDFGKRDLQKARDAFLSRKRRFGGLDPDEKKKESNNKK